MYFLRAGDLTQPDVVKVLTPTYLPFLRTSLRVSACRRIRLHHTTYQKEHRNAFSSFNCSNATWQALDHENGYLFLLNRSFAE